MTRRRLWSLTALACLLLALPGLPAAWRTTGLSSLAAAAEAVRTAAAAVAEQGLPVPDPRAAPVAMALASMLFGLGLLIRAHRRPATEVATALARRGRSIPAIARRTGLSQDAVRDLLGGDPMVVSTAVEGRFFRRARRSVPASAGTFADELEEKSFDARA